MAKSKSQFVTEPSLESGLLNILPTITLVVKESKYIRSAFDYEFNAFLS